MLSVSTAVGGVIKSDSLEVNTSQSGWQAMQSNGYWGATNNCNYVKIHFDIYSNRFKGMNRDDLICGPFLETGTRTAYSNSSQTNPKSLSVSISKLRKEINLPENATIDSVTFIYLSDDFIDSISLNETTVYSIDTVHYGQFPVSGIKRNVGLSKSKNYLILKPANAGGPYGTYFRAKIYYSYECCSEFIKCFGDSVLFYSNIHDTIAYDSLKWSFGDSLSSSNLSHLKDPKHLFSATGDYNVELVVYNSAFVNDTICWTVQIIKPPSFSVIPDTSLCIGDSLKIHPIDGLFIENGSWSSNQNVDSLIVYQSGTYIYASDNVCGTKIDSVTLSFITCNIGLSISDTCFSDSTVFKILLPDTINVDSVFVDFGDTQDGYFIKQKNIKHLYSNAGPHSIKVITFFKSHTDTFYTIVNIQSPPKFRLPKDSTLCRGGEIELYPLNSENLENTSWSSDQNLDTIVVYESGTYTFTSKNQCGEHSDSVIIRFVDCNIEFIISDTCFGDSTVFTLLLSDSLSLDSVVWDLGEGNTIIDDNGTIKYVYSKTGFFDVRAIVYLKEVIDTLKLTLSINSAPKFKLIDDLLICLGDHIDVYATSNWPLTSPIWSTGERTDTIRISEPILVSLSDTNLCGSYRDSIHISVKECKSSLIMPNVFSPNGDILNDVYLPIEMIGIQNIKIEIYNRWGERVYESMDLNTGWDGKLNGKPLPSSTYFWIVKYETLWGKNEIINGIVDLIQ